MAGRDQHEPTPKERLAIPPESMPAQPAAERQRNFTEVELGLTPEQAMREAQRCLHCPTRPCVDGCPVRVAIPDFIGALAAGDLPEAARILQRDNALPAVCGRVCPQERQCQSRCVRLHRDGAVGIGYLERFVADWAYAHPDEVGRLERAPASGRRVAVVGAGPAGLTAAGELALRGHAVTLFEALHDTGGVLRYGIPAFRLPKSIIDIEVGRLARLGVTVECNVIIGRTLTLDQLREQFDAVFVGSGAGLPILLDIPGENLKGVYTANEYLTRVNLMGAGMDPSSPTPVAVGRRVAVVGAGNTAMDCVRTARRLGAEEALIVYRRTRAEMPARAVEIEHAAEEGIRFLELLQPVEIVGESDGWVRGLRCQRMRLGAPDRSGRPRPEPIPEALVDIVADVVINALGNRPNPLLARTAPQLERDETGRIATDADGMTSLPGVFSGGDSVRGGATVINAMGDGKRAAVAIDRWLRGED